MKVVNYYSDINYGGVMKSLISMAIGIITAITTNSLCIGLEDWQFWSILICGASMFSLGYFIEHKSDSKDETEG